MNSFLTDYVQEQYNQTIRPTGELYLCLCFFCDDDTFRKYGGPEGSHMQIKNVAAN